MTEQQFMNAIAIAKSRSDCEPQNIDTLARIISETTDIPGDIAELGCYKGGATIAMAAAASFFTSKEPKYVYAFDLFGGLPYGDKQSGFESLGNVDFDEIQSAWAPYKNIIPIRGVHEQTVPTFGPRPLSLIFMDSDFYSSHVVCLKHLFPMLSRGGSMVFHDWQFQEVQQAIKEYFQANPREKYKCDYFDMFIAESQNMGLIRKRI